MVTTDATSVGARAAAARQLLDGPAPGIRSSRSLVAALLARQALEQAVDEIWAERAPAMAESTDRAQQITLRVLFDHDGGDVETLGRAVAWAWSRLSHFCHHRAYELAPTNAEVRSLLDVVDRLAAHQAAIGRGAEE